MKKLKGLSNPILTTDGQPLRQNERMKVDDLGRPILKDGQPVIEGDIVTPKFVLPIMIGRGASPDPIGMLQVAFGIRDAKDGTFELEDDELEQVKQIVLADTGYTNLVKATVLQIIQDATDPLEPKSKSK